VRAFVWHEADSFLHRLNPLTKLALSAPVVVIVSFAVEPLLPLALAALALLATRVLGRVPWPKLLRPLLFAVPLAFGFFWTSALFYAGPGGEPGAPAVPLGPWSIHTAALVFGLVIAGRILAIFASSLLFVLTTDPSRFVLALIQQARLSPRIGYSVFVGYRFVPLLQDELDNIRAAYQVRGAVARGPLGGLRRSFDYTIPLLAIAVRKGERVALAMESRAFGALPRRTYLVATSFGWHDLWFAVGALAALAAVVLLTSRTH
jgi:energy-coupling factor transport system permease protein